MISRLTLPYTIETLLLSKLSIPKLVLHGQSMCEINAYSSHQVSKNSCEIGIISAASTIHKKFLGKECQVSVIEKYSLDVQTLK